jgi:hypothetical protein
LQQTRASDPAKRSASRYEGTHTILPQTPS